ncbi:MAG TPA: hypothetical protein VEA59_00430 [Patescibacteria group bacterium]|nr:hypothetical protein [Patescibacteria group bacterium]
MQLIFQLLLWFGVGYVALHLVALLGGLRKLSETAIGFMLGSGLLGILLSNPFSLIGTAIALAIYALWPGVNVILILHVSSKDEDDTFAAIKAHIKKQHRFAQVYLVTDEKELKSQLKLGSVSAVIVTYNYAFNVGEDTGVRITNLLTRQDVVVKKTIHTQINQTHAAHVLIEQVSQKVLPHVGLEKLDELSI